MDDGIKQGIKIVILTVFKKLAGKLNMLSSAEQHLKLQINVHVEKLYMGWD